VTIQEPIEVIKKSVEVELPKSYLMNLRKQSADGLKDYTNEQIVEALAEDILDRYFSTEYFDDEAIINALS